MKGGGGAVVLVSVSCCCCGGGCCCCPDESLGVRGEPGVAPLGCRGLIGDGGDLVVDRGLLGDAGGDVLVWLVSWGSDQW